MQSKDKLREFAGRAFQGPGISVLNQLDFQASLKEMLTELELSVPSDEQLGRIWEKHRYGSEGVGSEEFEALLFRLLTFMLSTNEVDDVTPGKPAQGEKRDKNW